MNPSEPTDFDDDKLPDVAVSSVGAEGSFHARLARGQA